ALPLARRQSHSTRLGAASSRQTAGLPSPTPLDLHDGSAVTVADTCSALSWVFRVMAGPANDVAGTHGAGLARQFAATMEQRQRRNAADVELRAQRWLGFGIDLGQADLGFQLRRSLLEGWRHHAAGSTPRCPEIHQDR